MFRILHKIWREKDVPPSKFWEGTEKAGPELKALLVAISQEICWKGTKNELLKRIRKVALKKGFSAREVKLLRKLVNEQKKNGYTDFEEVQYYFPGKTTEMLEEKYNEKYANLYWRLTK